VYQSWFWRCKKLGKAVTVSAKLSHILRGLVQAELVTMRFGILTRLSGLKRVLSMAPLQVRVAALSQGPAIVTKVEGVRGAAAAKKTMGHDDEHNDEALPKDGKMPASCGPENTGLDEEDEMESMFVQGPAGMEWGGPTRGGQRPEPTRFGDWERKGRATDF